ncbi:hypothetical protein Tco_1053783 [Tanacetum coccineum]|uniref:Uncharacterized protein n=1 Tax=Tanacetum coccineum TaxID=301880 RepID=A0ABQ5GUX8_9ASTR
MLAEAQENIAKVQEKLDEEEIDKMVEGSTDEESYASEFADSILSNDGADVDDTGSKIEPGSQKENSESVSDDDETKKEKEDVQDIKEKETKEVGKEHNLVEKEVEDETIVETEKTEEVVKEMEVANVSGSIVGMGRQRNLIRSHIKNKLITREFFSDKIQEVLKHCDTIVPKLTVSTTNEMLEKEMPRLVKLTVNKDRVVSPIDIYGMVSKEFAAHGPMYLIVPFQWSYDTQYCIKNPEQASVDYTSSRIKEVGGKRFTPNHEPINFNDTANTWKEKPNFNWAHTQTFTSLQGGSISVHSSSNQMKLDKALLDFDSNQEKKLSHRRTQLEQQQDDMIGKINLLWKTISEKLNNVSTPENARNLMASKSIATISHDEREELRKKGIKNPSKLLSLKYLSPASIKELNKNPSAPKRVHFINSIVILSTNSDTEEDDDSSTNACDLNLGSTVKRKEEVKEQGKEENEMETDMEVEEEIDEEGSEFD